ncbi:hypothetical protein KIJ00_04005 [Leuconostoc gelidum subsp. aenigmaticum]|uniref:hypothetical protein n=1 Tax=Leuconostoc gelidum TaxID=1244 RepID=UPI001CC7CE0E|nr:hypothetical protein [Leuconostoc gelidum]MBZ6008419.1 hypothetical protein [Leuconostoc gelidum subsp. aenigmaticum]
MQQGHPRHKQLIKSRHEMVMHRRYIFARKINEGMHSFVNGVRKAMNSVVNAIFNTLETKPLEEKPEIKDIYSEMYKPKGLMQIVPPRFNK